MSGFVIKITSAHGDATMWLGASAADAPRVFGPRETAEVFRTQSLGHAVIGEMPLAFERAGFVFSVESAD
jgi:hypothetical protein